MIIGIRVHEDEQFKLYSVWSAGQGDLFTWPNWRVINFLKLGARSVEESWDRASLLGLVLETSRTPSLSFESANDSEASLDLVQGISQSSVVVSIEIDFIVPWFGLAPETQQQIPQCGLAHKDLHVASWIPVLPFYRFMYRVSLSLAIINPFS